MNQYCSRNTLQDIYRVHFDEIDERLRGALQKDIDDQTGSTKAIEIVAVRVTKPKTPTEVAAHFNKIEEEETARSVSERRRNNSVYQRRRRYSRRRRMQRSQGSRRSRKRILRLFRPKLG